MTTLTDKLNKAEELLGNNLVFISDTLDQAVRQKDERTIAALNALTEAWHLILNAQVQLVSVKTINENI